MSQEHLDQLLAAVGDARRVLIMPHNDPDPDAIASAVALRYLLQAELSAESEIVCRGLIGRAENRALAHYLGNPLRRLADEDLADPPPIALVDTQPGAGNNALPSEIAATLVIDHHPRREGTDAVLFADVRPDWGSTSTILTEYLRAADIELPATLATALYFGLKSDTMGLIRSTHTADREAFCFLQPRIDTAAVEQIETAPVPVSYFHTFVKTMQAAHIFDGVLVAYLGAMEYPDMAAEMADFLFKLDGVDWILCMGVNEEKLMLSVRTRRLTGGAGMLVQQIVGRRGTAGGHGTMAGGNIRLQGRDPEELAAELTERALRILKVPTDVVGKPLI